MAIIHTHKLDLVYSIIQLAEMPGDLKSMSYMIQSVEHSAVEQDARKNCMDDSHAKLFLHSILFDIETKAFFTCFLGSPQGLLLKWDAGLWYFLCFFSMLLLILFCFPQGTLPCYDHRWNKNYAQELKCLKEYIAMSLKEIFMKLFGCFISMLQLFIVCFIICTDGLHSRHQI